MRVRLRCLSYRLCVDGKAAMIRSWMLDIWVLSFYIGALDMVDVEAYGGVIAAFC